MQFDLILLSGFIGTSLMTLFSYIMSVIMKDHFREPQLLNQLINGSSFIPFHVNRFSLTGWIIHFAIGFAFAFLFNLAVNLWDVDANLLNGLLFGFVAGIAGITGWKIMFRLVDYPPEISLNRFLFQLIIAHLIFGAGLILTY